MSLEFRKFDSEIKEDSTLSANTFQAQTIIMNQYNTTNVTSHNQTGGETVGLKNSNQIMWNGRKEGFLVGIVSGIIVEIIIRLIF